jgi:hypothetical protein
MNNNDATTEFYNDLVLATAVRLIKQNGSTTTLDIKNELRIRHATIDVGPITFRPNLTQNIVSDAMIILADNSYFSYSDNGTFRTYYLNTVEFDEQEDDEVTTVNLNLWDSIKLISELKKNEDITATFIKHDGSLRTITGTVYTPNNGLGIMLVYDMELPDGIDGSNIRTVELRKLISFVIEGVTYIVDKNIK